MTNDTAPYLIFCGLGWFVILEVQLAVNFSDVHKKCDEILRLLREKKEKP